LIAETPATALVGRCPPYGEGNSFSPLAEIVAQIAGSDPEPRLVEIMGGGAEAVAIARKTLAGIGLPGEPGNAEETAWAVRRLFERLARAGPLVVALDDVHWAGPTLLDLLEHVAAFSSGAPILIVCIARPELLESRPSWALPQPRRSQLVLEGLPDAHARRLVAAAGLESQLAGRIVDTAEGNPLFLEQLVAAQAEQEEAALPPTLQTVLAARIDRLEPGERTLLRHASVEGRRFHPGALPEAAETHLFALVQKQFVHPDRTVPGGEDAFRFAHGLIREAAYEGLPKQLRAELHERIARWSAQQPDHQDEIVGFHLERAHRSRLELGPAGERERALAREASSRLAGAAETALLRGDPPAGAQLLERAAGLLEPEDPARRALLPRLGGALFDAGRLADADRVLAEAVALAAAAGDAALGARARVEREFVRLQSVAGTRRGDVREIADAAQAVLGDDDIGQCRAWCLRALAEWTEGQAGAADDAWRRAAGHARRAGDRRELFEALCWRASAAVFGPTAVPEAIRRCEEIRDQVDSSPVALAVTLHPLGSLHAMTGDFETARRLIREGNEILGELGRMQSAVSHHEALVELLGGQPAAAEQRLRLGYDKLEPMGERGLLATTAAMLAQALYDQGRSEEAGAQCDVSEAAAPHEDFVTQAMWRGVRAKLLARAGALQAGETLAREALRLIERTDLLTHQGDALLDLADVLWLAGRGGEATEAARRALDLYERKGNLVSAQRAAVRLGESTEVDDASLAVRPGRDPRGGRTGLGLRLGGGRDG
jgi:tetratricopeptide (TPR) repeat protein